MTKIIGYNFEVMIYSSLYLLLHPVKQSDFSLFKEPKILTVETSWTCTNFSDLTNIELYKILQLRNEVFIIEQNCPYQDCDEKDFDAFHLCAWQGNQLVAYSRLLPPGISFPEKASIGRVLTANSARKQDLGRELMIRSIRKVYTLFGRVDIAISAQCYLKDFYESFSFIQVSETFLEDDIPHMTMELAS